MSDRIRVLYVDGDRDRRRAVRETLEAAGMDVRTVESADEGAAAIRGRRVDCVVSEYRLPDADGLSFYQRLFPHLPGVGFVLYTVHGSEALAGEALAAGVDAYVPATAPPETLIERVEAAAPASDRVRRIGPPRDPAVEADVGGDDPTLEPGESTATPGTEENDDEPDRRSAGTTREPAEDEDGGAGEESDDGGAGGESDDGETGIAGTEGGEASDPGDDDRARSDDESDAV